MIDPDGDVPGGAASKAKSLAADELRFRSVYTYNDELDMLSAEGEHSEALICSSLVESSSPATTPRHNGTIGNHLTVPAVPRARRVGVTILEPDEELDDWLPAGFQVEYSDSDDHTDQQVMSELLVTNAGVTILEPDEELDAWLPAGSQAEYSNSDDHTDQQVMSELLVANGGCWPTSDVCSGIAEQQENRRTVRQDSDYNDNGDNRTAGRTLDADQKPLQSGHKYATKRRSGLYHEQFCPPSTRFMQTQS